MAMDIDNSTVTFLVNIFYNINADPTSIRPLCGYSDKNFKITDLSDGSHYVLKVVNAEDSIEELAG